jgi:hypothetical protein
MKTRISKAYRANQHVGWKKTVGGREWFLGYGISPSEEQKAIRLAEVLEAKWKLAKIAGATALTQNDFEEAKALLSGQPRWSIAQEPAEKLAQHRPGNIPTSVAMQSVPVESPSAAESSPSRRWLHTAIDEFTMLPNGSTVMLGDKQLSVTHVAPSSGLLPRPSRRECCGRNRSES